MHPLAANLVGVRASDERKIVFHLRAPNQLIDAWLQEEWIAETKRRPEAHSGIGMQVRRGRRPRTCFSGISDVRLIQRARRQRREPVQVRDVDARGVALDAVGRRAVGGHIEGFVLFPGMIEIP